MFCTNCGANNPETGTFCNQCGQRLDAASPTTAPPPPPGPPMPRAAQPATYAQAGPDVPTDGKATASLVLGVLSLTFFSIFAGIPAVILGHMSRGNIKRSMGRLKGEGLALAGLIMGYISFAAIPIVLIIAAIAIPNLLRARMAANEASAVGSLRTINSAQATYASIHADQGFASDLADLQRDALLDEVLASGRKSGYSFSYEAQDVDGDGVRDAYFVTAEPLSPGSSGQRRFCSDQTGVIRYERAGTCTPESSELD